MSEFVYIENGKQKNFYLKNGCEMLDANINSSTNRIYWKFARNETNKVYSKWIQYVKTLKVK